MTDKKTSKNLNTSIHSIFQTNGSLEEDGAWVTINEYTKLRIKVRRMNSAAVAKVTDSIVREWVAEGTIKDGEEPDLDMAKELVRLQLSKAVLVDWENLKDNDTGEDVPFSEEAAYALLGVKDFVEFVQQAANERDTFREKVLSKQAKN